MKMRDRTKLTLRFVEGLMPKDKDHFAWDSEVVGFGIKVSVGGHKSYVLQYRHEGRSRRYTIGAHGSPWAPDTARTEAKRLLGAVAGSIDVQSEKTERRLGLTVAELCDQYVSIGLATKKPASVAAARSAFDNHVKPLLGNRKAESVTRADVERLLIDVSRGATAKRARGQKKRSLSRVRGGEGAANSVVRKLGSAFAFGIGRGVRPDNPTIGISRFQERKIERFLSAAELVRLGEVLAAAEALGVENVYAIAAIRLLIMTGCRRNEILTLKRSYVDYANKCLRLPDSKTGAKVVHIGAAAVTLFSSLPEVQGNPYVLPGKNGESHLVGLQKFWVRVRSAAGLDDVRIHDLRHSFASFGANGGDSLLVIGALLGHRSAQATERYAHLSSDPVKRAADRISSEIAELLGSVVTDASGGEVVDLTSASSEDLAPVRTILGQVVKARWLDTREVSARVNLTVTTLQTYRWMGVGPPFQKIGGRVVYSADEVDAWKATQASCDVGSVERSRRSVGK